MTPFDKNYNQRIFWQQQKKVCPGNSHRDGPLLDVQVHSHPLCYKQVIEKYNGSPLFLFQLFFILARGWGVIVSICRERNVRLIFKNTFWKMKYCRLEK